MSWPPASLYQPKKRSGLSRRSRTINTGSNMIQHLNDKLPVCDFRPDVYGRCSIRGGDFIPGGYFFVYENIGHMNHGQLDTGKQPNNCLDLIILHDQPSWVNL